MTRRSKRAACTSGRTTRKKSTSAERQREEAAPVVGGDAVDHELVAVGDHVEPRERDRRVDGEVDAYHHSYESLRRTTTIEVTTTASRSAVPTVAVMMPGYGAGGRRVARGAAEASADDAGWRQRQPVPVLAQERVACPAARSPRPRRRRGRARARSPRTRCGGARRSAGRTRRARSRNGSRASRSTSISAR